MTVSKMIYSWLFYGELRWIPIHYRFLLNFHYTQKLQRRSAVDQSPQYHYKFYINYYLRHRPPKLRFFLRSEGGLSNYNKFDYLRFKLPVSTLLLMELPYGVYILLCANNQYYTGYTTNITNRLLAHNKGAVSFTKDKLPVKLVHFSLFVTKQKAYDFERYLKSGSGIAFRNKRII